METKESDYLDVLDVVISQYREFLLYSGDHLISEELLEKMNNVVKNVAAEIYFRHGISLDFPKIVPLFDGTVNIIYENGEEFLLFQLSEESDKMPYMAKDNLGNTMSGVLSLDNTRLAPFLFFKA